jgi:hypothetical protein
MPGSFTNCVPRQKGRPAERNSGGDHGGLGTEDAPGDGTRAGKVCGDKSGALSAGDCGTKDAAFGEVPAEVQADR